MEGRDVYASGVEVNHSRQSWPDVPEDVDYIMEHLNDPNWDFKVNPASRSREFKSPKKLGYEGSDYDYESASEEFSDAQESPSTPESESPAASTPPRRRSHEITARVVSVVFSGKPSVIELPRRIGTPGSSRASDSDLAAARKRQDSDKCNCFVQ